MKVYALTNARLSYGAQDVCCYGIFPTKEKAKAAMKKAIEETKENWVESDVVEDKYEIGVTKSEVACILETDERQELFKIEEIESDEVFND